MKMENIMENIYKNKIHLEPPTGLLNDPNGLCFFNDTYYLFHQWNRFKCDHSYKEWGLFTSTDLLNWKHQGSAILPDTPKDSHGVYSGSAITADQRLRIFYTGNTRNKLGLRKSYQNIAESTDGHTYIKKSSFETPLGLTENNRDPFVFKYKDLWFMIVGSQTTEYNGVVTLYTSSNLDKWSYQGIFFQSSELLQMCECPNLINFESIQILLACAQRKDRVLDTVISSTAGYFVGKISKDKFIATTKFLPLDYGFDFYAPQVLKAPDGRYLLWGWMSNMSAAEEKACPTINFGYLHCLTIPREIAFEKGKLIQRPLREILNASTLLIQNTDKIFNFNQTSKALLLQIDFNDSISDFTVNFATGAATLHHQKGKLILQRHNWSSNEIESRYVSIDKVEHLKIFIDLSAVEIFINDSSKVLSMRYFPNHPIKTHTFFCKDTHVVTLFEL